jgi:hypothetical protein
VSSPAELARKCFAVAARSTTLPGERDAAIGRGMAVLERHGLNPDHFDIPGRQCAPSITITLDAAVIEAAQRHMREAAMAKMAARMQAEMVARSLAERLLRERVRARSPFMNPGA